MYATRLSPGRKLCSEHLGEMRSRDSDLSNGRSRRLSFHLCCLLVDGLTYQGLCRKVKNETVFFPEVLFYTPKNLVFGASLGLPGALFDSQVAAAEG